MPTQRVRSLHVVVGCALLTALQASVAPARADFMNVGSIVIDQFDDFNNRQRAGANFTIHYELNEAFAQQTCVTADSLRWIQLIRLSKPIFFGNELTPNRPFIDPRKDQFIPGTPTGKGDDLPFYDLTFPTLADIGNKEKALVNGSGAYLVDQPRVDLGARPFSFTAVTLLVSIQPDQTLGVLGGVRWGYSVADDFSGSVTLFGPEYVAGNSALIRGFNRALPQDFPGWTIKLPSQLWPDAQPAVNLAPAPPSVILLALGGLLSVCLWRKKRMAGARA